MDCLTEALSTSPRLRCLRLASLLQVDHHDGITLAGVKLVSLAISNVIVVWMIRGDDAKKIQYLLQLTAGALGGPLVARESMPPFSITSLISATASWLYAWNSIIHLKLSGQPRS